MQPGLQRETLFDWQQKQIPAAAPKQAEKLAQELKKKNAGI